MDINDSFLQSSTSKFQVFYYYAVLMNISCFELNVNLPYWKQDRSDTVSLHPALEVDDQSDIDQSFLGCVVSALNLKWFTDPIFLLMIASKYH